MWPYFISEIETSPHLFWVVVAIGLHILNSTLGILVFFGKNNFRRSHLLFFLGIFACLIIFFLENQPIRGNGFVEWFVLIYFAVLIPLSKRWDVRIHTLIATVGLTLLPLLILLQIIKRTNFLSVF